MDISSKTKGRLRIYLGYATGAGKSFNLLKDARLVKDRGGKIAIASIGNSTRSGICDMAAEFPRIQESNVLDVEAVIASEYETVIIDDLAQTNAPQSKNKKRFEDVLEILAGGKNVFTTINVQHIDSIAERLNTALQLNIQERVPDKLLARADAIVFVDISLHELQARIRSGQVFAKDKAEQALFHFFTYENLSLLRKLALEVLAEDQLQKIEDERVLGSKGREEADPAVLIVINDEAEHVELFERMIHKGAKYASSYRSHMHVSMVHPTKLLKLKKEGDTPSPLAAQLKTLTHYLGGTFIEIKGPGLSEQIVQYCQEHSVKHLVFAKEHVSGFIQKVIDYTRGIDIHLIDRAKPKGEHL